MRHALELSSRRRLAEQDRRFGKALERYGAVFNGTADDKAAIQNAINAVSGTTKGTLVFPDSNEVAGCKINSGITIDVSKTGVDFNNISIDASSITSGSVITLTGSSASGYGLYDQHVVALERLRLLGNGQAGTVTALNLTPGTGLAGVANVEVRDIMVKDFGIGEAFGDNAYLTNHYNCNYYDCGLAISVPSGANKGEGLRWFGSVIANGVNGINLADPETDMFFYGMHMDYNTGYLLTQTAGRTHFSGCHFEGSDDTSTWFILSGSGSRASFVAGEFVHTAGAPHAVGQYFNITSPAAARLSGSLMVNFRNTAEHFAIGTGLIVVDGTKFYDVSEMPYALASDLRNSLVDGGFETTESVGFYCTGAATFDARGTGTSVATARSTTTANTGTGSLAITRSTGADATANCYIPLSNSGQVMSVRYWDRNISGAVTGTYTYNMQWVRIGTNQNGLPSIIASQNIGSPGAITPTNTWTMRGERPVGSREAPVWANALEFRFDLTSLGNGTIYIDDFSVSGW